MKEFKKWDLRSGDLIENRKGRYYIVLLGSGVEPKDIVVASNGFWYELSDISNELEHADSELTIVRVFRPKYPIKSLEFEIDKRELVFDRSDGVPELTMNEVIDKLGFEFKLIKQ